jgi:hypothetical protein
MNRGKVLLSKSLSRHNVFALTTTLCNTTKSFLLLQVFLCNFISTITAQIACIAIASSGITSGLASRVSYIG